MTISPLLPPPALLQSTSTSSSSSSPSINNNPTTSTPLGARRLIGRSVWPDSSLSTAAIIVFAVWLWCSFLGRFCGKKQLRGSSVLIVTSADEDADDEHNNEVSEALTAQLTDHYHCRVVLIRPPGQRKNARTASPMTLQLPHLCTVYECNVRDPDELHTLQERIRKDVGYVDVVIENGIPTKRTAAVVDVCRFIEKSSNRIRATLNVKISCIK